MKRLEIFGHRLTRVAAPDRDLKASLDRECSMPRFHVEKFKFDMDQTELLKVMDKVRASK